MKLQQAAAVKLFTDRSEVISSVLQNEMYLEFYVFVWAKTRSQYC